MSQDAERPIAASERQARGVAAGEVAAGSGERATVAEPLRGEPVDEVALLDIGRLETLRELERITGSPTLTPAIECFASSPRVADLGQLVAAGAWAEVRRVSHSLKGSSATLGAARLTVLAQWLEHAAAETNAAAAQQLQRQLEIELERTVSALRRFVAGEPAPRPSGNG